MKEKFTLVLCAGDLLDARVDELMHREWRCVFDAMLLEGMLYESVLGHAMARLLSIGDCRARAAELGLPTVGEIAAAARRVIGKWGKS